MEHIAYIRNLLKAQISLQKQQNGLAEEIENIQSKCEHITICLGYDGEYPSKDTAICQCLLCTKTMESENICSPYIEACTYQKGTYGNGENFSARSDRLEKLQNLWLQIEKENPNLTREERIMRIKKEIMEDEQRNKDYEKQLVRKFI